MSVAGGLARGIQTGLQLRQQSDQLSLSKKQQEQQRKEFVANAMSERLDATRSQMAETFQGMTEIMSELLSNGADITDERFQSAIANLDQMLATSTALETSMLETFIQEGFDPVNAATMIGMPGQFAQNQATQIAAALSLSGLDSPELRARAEGRGAVSEASEILGREPSADERQRLAGVDPPASLVTVNTGNEQESAFLEQTGKNEAEIISQARESARVARNQLVEIERIQAALDSGRFQTGPFADARVYLSRLFEFAGLEPPVDMLGDAATADTLDAAAAKLGIDLAGELGRVTNMSLLFVERAVPALTRTVEGNRILAEVMERAARRSIQVGQIANEMVRAGSMQPEGEPSYWDRIDQLDEEDPVITDELRKRIEEGSKAAPTSFRAFKNPFEPFKGKLPPGVPEGSTIAFTKNGNPVYETPDGKLLMVKPTETDDGDGTR